MYVMEGSSTNTLSVRRTYILLQTGGDNIMLSYAYIILYGIIILYAIHTEVVIYTIMYRIRRISRSLEPPTIPFVCVRFILKV